MRTLLCYVSLFACVTAQSQTWQWTKHIGGPGQDAASIRVVDGMGNMYMTGAYAGSMQNTYQGCYFAEDTLTGSRDAFMAKYSAEGQLLWLRDISGPGLVWIGPPVLDTLHGAFYLLGTFQWNCALDTCTVSSAIGGGVFLAKWNLAGRCLWARTIATSGLPSGNPGVVACGLVRDANGDLLASLRGDPYAPTLVEGQPMQSGSFLCKYNRDGGLLWSKPFTAFSGSQKSILLTTFRVHEDRIYGFGPATISQENDTTVVDTIEIVGRHGQGFALVSLDPANGMAEWFRLEGFPDAYSGFIGMDTDMLGNMTVAGTYGGADGTAVFEADTLRSTVDHSKGFIAKYTTAGTLQYVRQFIGSQAFGITAVDVAEDGTMALCGEFRGGVTLGDSTYAANTNADLFVAIHSPTGEPRAFTHASGGTGNSVHFLDDDLVVCGGFPANTTMPIGSMSIGGDTYDTHGYADIVVARTNLPTSVPQKSRGDDHLLIYANPNQGSFRIVMPERVRYAANLMLRVYDSTGRQLHQQKLDMGEQRPKVDLFGVSPGYYMVTLGDGQVSYSGSLVVD